MTEVVLHVDDDQRRGGDVDFDRVVIRSELHRPRHVHRAYQAKGVATARPDVAGRRAKGGVGSRKCHGRGGIRNFDQGGDPGRLGVA
jgi:hypothetical protein